MVRYLKCWQKNIFEKGFMLSTVKENEYLLNKMLDTIYALNSKMKIYVIL